MKTRISLLLACAVFMPGTLVAQSTAFTYQGRLNAGDSPANGIYEMSFALYDAPTNGNVVGTPVTAAPLPVTNGLFTATLDFGAGAFMGADRWIEIAVTVFGTDQPVVTLMPRQPIAPVPYALHAANAAGLMNFANAPLDIKVNGQRALRLEPTADAPNVIGGSPNNFVNAGVVGATIAGGGTLNPTESGSSNSVSADFGSVGGGVGNISSGVAAVVSGGLGNANAVFGGVIGGGVENRIHSDSGASTIGGGYGNFIFEFSGYGAIAGGYNNTINDNAGEATISGGSWNSIGASSASIGGGAQNVVVFPGHYAVISGGFSNFVGHYYATVGGGQANSVRAQHAMIGGGFGNSIAAEADASAIAGGSLNSVGTNARSNFIGGGGLNRIDGASSSAIVSGFDNHLGSYASVISGGRENGILENSEFGSIGGGENNHIADNSPGSSISGGSGNGISAGASHATIGGGSLNYVGNSSHDATIGGGRENIIAGGSVWSTVGGGNGNHAAGNISVVAGGEANYTTGDYATVGGGGLNIATGFGSVVAGGGGVHFEDGNEPRGNTAHGDWSVVGGGADNLARGAFCVIGGGEANQVSGNYGMIPGGLDCLAAGQLSFAAGWGAHALHDGSFVWSGYGPPLGGPHFESTTNDQFSARAAGGVRFFTDFAATTGAELAPGSGTWSSLSDRHAKENFAPASPREILDKVAALPMTSWNYKAQDKSVRHLGPMAQDFHAAFGLGESERTITTVDADGVALAAIQGLNAKLEEELKAKDTRIAELERRLAGIEKLLATGPAK